MLIMIILIKIINLIIMTFKIIKLIMIWTKVIRKIWKNYIDTKVNSGNENTHFQPLREWDFYFLFSNANCVKLIYFILIFKLHFTK